LPDLPPSPLDAKVSRKSSEEAGMASEGIVIVSGDSSGFAQDVELGKFHLKADEPVAKGGTDTGPAPYPLLLASLGSCTSMTVSMYARAKNWPLKSVKVQLRHSKMKIGEPTAEEDKAPERDYIEREIQLIGDLSEEQHQRLLEIANKCPVHRTLTSTIEINTKLI
jgi:putative redox protein